MTTNLYPGIGYKTQGYNQNFFQKIAVSATTFGGSSVSGQQPDLILPFSTNTVILTNYSGLDGYQDASGSGIIEYSTNGLSVDGELTAWSATTQSGRSHIIFQDRRLSMLWFRVQSGSSGTITVAVEAWCIP